MIRIVAFAVGTLMVATEASPQELQRWDLVPESRLGGGGVDDAVLFGVKAAFPATSGSMYIASLREGLEEYDGSARQARRFGRTGEGPGEFRTVFAAGLIADRLWIYDLRLRRVSTYSPSGAFIESFPARGEPAPGFVINSVAGLTDQNKIVGIEVPSIPSERLIADPKTNVRIALHSLVDKRRIEVDEGRFGSPFILVDGGAILAFPYLSDHMRVAVHPRGDGFVTVHSETAGSSPYFYTVRGFSSSGERLFERRVQYTPRSINEAELQGFIRDKVGGSGTTTQELATIRRRLVVPPHMPPVSDVLLSDDGGIWVRTEESLTGGSVRWFVLAPSASRIEAVLLLPADLRLTYASASSAIGVRRDEFDAEYVVRFRVERP